MLTEYDISRVLERYQLGRIVNITQARRGFVNETAFVQTSQGKYVVRRSHRRLGATAQRYRHDLVAWLQAQQFPADHIIPARDGSTLLQIDGRFYEVRDFIKGEDFNPAHPRQINNAGAILARYHQTIAGFPPPPDAPNPRYSPQTVMGLTERVLERDVMSELQDPLHWYDLRAAKLRQLLPRPTYDALPHLVIHGDVHVDNFLFHGDEVAALIDYDQATWDARIVDVADGLVAFATDCSFADWMTWGVFRGPLDEERSTRLISGYASVAPLTPAEIATLPIIVELIWLQGDLGRVLSTPEGSPDYHTDVLQQGRWLSEWMSGHAERLVSHWSAAAESAGASSQAMAA